MLFQLIIGPFSTLHTLPKGMSLALLALTAITASISLGTTGVKAGLTRGPEVANITISFVFIALSLLGFVWQFGWHRLEDNFDSFPWAQLHAGLVGQPCPFTGLRPDKRCPNCKVLVHSSAFHTQEKLTTFYVGESVLGWDKAKIAGNLVDSPEEGRALLDEALDFRGNYYFGCTGNACIGCSSHQRCFCMLPRWALILACIASVGSLVPWAFRGSLLTVDHGGKIQAIAETYGIFFSLTAVFIQLHSIACAVVFMTTYQRAIPFPSPVVLPAKGYTRHLFEFMAGQKVALPGKPWHSGPRSFGEAWTQLSKSLSEIPGQIEKHLDKR